ncbi:hypothetical protein [Nonomuraea endophytica]|uniref:hypothetical protein n=1 Tax=Nonomuraea endophytica TaxID=714136 RepID=UPI0037C6E04F
MNLFEVYRDTYLAVRAKYGHPDEPIPYGERAYLEALPPKGWDRAQYATYFDEVTRLAAWYQAARRYAAKKRKTDADRSAYLVACDQYAVAGRDLRFAGEPAQTALL